MTSALHSHQWRDYLSPSFVIMKVHSCSHTPSFLVLCFCWRLHFFRRVNKLACELNPVVEIIAAASPFPALRGLQTLARGVTAAVSEVARTAGLCYSMHYASTGHRIYEGRLLASALQDVAKDALFIVSSCTVPAFVAELVLAFLNAPACAIRHRTNSVWVLQAHFDLLFREAWQWAAHRSSCCYLRVFLRLTGA
jgi:hypothetical protein